MSDILLLVSDLECLGRQMNIQLLKHHFETCNPSSNSLRESIKGGRLNDLESSDYRAAYTQFHDWLFGWSVATTTDTALQIPRDIDLKLQRERDDIDILLQTFETLSVLTRRRLKKLYGDIEADIPNVGRGLSTIVSKSKALAAIDPNDHSNPDNLWKNTQNASEPIAILPEMFDIIEGTSNTSQNYLSATGGSTQSTALNSRKDLVKDSFDIDAKVSIRSENSDDDEPISMISKRELAHGDSKPVGSFSFLSQNISPKGLANGNNEALELQQDLDIVFTKVDLCTDYTLIHIVCISIILALTQLKDDKVQYNNACQLGHEISMDFVSNTLKACWTLFNIQIPQEMSMTVLRNPRLMGLMINKLKESRIPDVSASANTPLSKFRVKKLHHKFSALNELLRILDINVFPNFIPAHIEGAKCASFSTFDSNLWLTGGNDCVIRISDIRDQNDHICLAQYVGHKSIITDVHFTRSDSHLVSCSYDRTIRIWNSQSSVVERTLLGHTDAVLSCDVSPDGRWIASGSMDCSLRIWDFATGRCLNTIEKHSRWIKVVRFSIDGRYLATAGMDRHVYIWDTKIITKSKTPTHSRCIDNFNDYVLDMAFHKPSLLLAASRDSTVRLFDFITGHELNSVNLAPSWACTVTFAESGEYFATGSFDNNVNIFETKTFAKLREIRVFNLGIMCVRFPLDNSYIAVGTVEGFLQQVPL